MNRIDRCLVRWVDTHPNKRAADRALLAELAAAGLIERGRHGWELSAEGHEAKGRAVRPGGQHDPDPF